MTKKVLNLSLAASICISSTIGSSAQAASFGNTIDYGTYGATYTGKVHDDGNSIMYAVGGKYTLKMNPPTPQAWFNVQPPSVSLGCAGLSFKGMFMSLLNISQIGDQLKDAGAAFAWGIILGLVTSLPGIKEVFDTINKWAAQIQSLIANACNIGKKLGSNPSQFQADLSSAGDLIANDFKAAKEYTGTLQESMGDIKKHISDYLTKANEWAASTDTGEDKEGMIFESMREFFKNPGYMSNVISSDAREMNLPVSSYISGADATTSTTNKGEFYDPGVLTIKTEPSSLNNGQIANWQVKIVTAILASNLVGRTGASSEHIKGMKSFYTESVKAVRNGGVSPETIKNLLSDVAAFMKTTDDTKIIINPTISVAEAASWIKTGEFPTGKLVMPKIVGFSSPAKQTGRPKLFFVDAADGSVVLNQMSGWGAVFDKYGNVYELAAKQVACVTRDSVAGAVYNASQCNSLPPVLLPQVQDYMYIYSQSLPEDQEAVVGDLVNYLAAEWISALIARIQQSSQAVLAAGSTGSTVATAPGVSGNNKAARTGFDNDKYKVELEKINKVIRDLKDELSVNSPELILLKDRLSKQMNDLRAKNSKRGIGASSRN